MNQWRWFHLDRFRSYSDSEPVYPEELPPTSFFHFTRSFISPLPCTSLPFCIPPSFLFPSVSIEYSTANVWIVMTSPIDSWRPPGELTNRSWCLMQWWMRNELSLSWRLWWDRAKSSSLSGKSHSVGLLEGSHTRALICIKTYLKWLVDAKRP